MVYELDITPRVIVGADTRTKVGEQARRLGFTRVLVVSDPFHEQAGRVDEIVHALNAAGLEASVYAGVATEPDTEMVERGAEQFRADDCDGIVALGGGSPIDTAKTISVLVTNDGTVQQFMGTDTVPEPGAGVIALPTTSGTGSEATKV
ncbi:MAG: iron-containing alcohol dehydrogenase, partial [Phycisphaerales bacterium]